MDKTWTINLMVKITTMGGWEPEESDIQNWLDEGGLELVKIESMTEAIE
jgi:hypothetical protein